VIRKMKLFWFPLTIALILVVAVGTLVFRAKNITQISEPEPTPTPYVSSDQVVPSEASIFMNQDYEIMLRAPNLVVSAVAIRVTYDFSGGEVSRPILSINQDLVSENWSYPVKSVSLNGSLLDVDLAAVNMSPEGFLVSNEIKLATLDFGESTPDPSLFKFDVDQTKLISKDGVEINLNLN
jgi:hypothetical protein